MRLIFSNQNKNSTWSLKTEAGIKFVNVSHCWILEAKMDMALGLHFICPDGRGGHPLTVRQNIKDHLCSIIPRPIRWQGYDTLQMILNILGHHQRVSSSPAPVAGI